jgi:hypothetical protein
MRNLTDRFPDAKPLKTKAGPQTQGDRNMKLAGNDVKSLNLDDTGTITIEEFVPRGGNIKGWFRLDNTQMVDVAFALLTAADPDILSAQGHELDTKLLDVHRRLNAIVSTIQAKRHEVAAMLDDLDL